jgi:hypothetical protein
MCTRPTHSRVKSLRAEQVVCEAASWPSIRTGLYTHVYTCTHLHAQGRLLQPRGLVRVMVRRWSRTGCTVPPPHRSRQAPLTAVWHSNTLTARQWAKHRPTASRAVCSLHLKPRRLFTGHPPLLQRHAHDGAGVTLSTVRNTARWGGSFVEGSRGEARVGAVWE